MSIGKLRPISALSAPDPAHRRWSGLALGVALGLVYGATTQLINRVFLPGVPLYQPPLGPLGNSALFAAGGALLGLICAWPAGGVQGAFLASAISALALVVGSFVSARPSSGLFVAAAVTGIFLMLPFWGLLVPFLAALRWGVNRIEEARRDRLPLYRRLPAPLLLMLAAALAGALVLYHADVRGALARMAELLEAGQQASSATTLPAPLQSPGVGDFLAHGQKTSYSLAPEAARVERFRIPRPARNFDSHQFVVARFANGWNLVCVFITPDEPPLCQGFDQLPP